eukprot:gene1558-1976_t
MTEIAESNTNRLGTQTPPLDSSMTSPPPTPIPYYFLPSIRIQYDWELAYKHESDSFWVSYHKDLKNTINGSIRSTKKSNDNFLFESDNAFKLNINNNNLNHIELTCENHTIDIYAPTTIHNVAKGQKRITSMGVSNLGELGVYGCTDGLLEVFETDDGQIRRKLEGHVGDVDLTMFFPSGKVILSGASDARLKIWDAIEGTCAVTLSGHIAGITSASLIDRGRNFVSSSRDGTVKLWDVPSASTISTLTQCQRPINDCFVTSFNDSNSGDNNNSNNKVDEREFGTDGKVVVLAAEEGFLQLIDLRSKQTISQLNVPSLPNQRKSAMNTCLAQNNLILSGDHDGSIYLWEKRNMSTPFERLQFSNSPIHHFKQTPIPSNSVWTSSGDGSIYLINLKEKRIEKSLSGIDTDVVTSLNIVNDQAFSTSRDSLVRCFNKIQ